MPRITQTMRNHAERRVRDLAREAHRRLKCPTPGTRPLNKAEKRRAESLRQKADQCYRKLDEIRDELKKFNLEVGNYRDSTTLSGNGWVRVHIAPEKMEALEAEHRAKLNKLEAATLAAVDGVNFAEGGETLAKALADFTKVVDSIK